MSRARLELDYVATPRRLRWPGLLVLAVALATAAHLAVRQRDIQRERDAISAGLDLLDAGRRATRPVNARPEQEARDIAAVLRQLALPWPQMIECVESTASREVVLLQLQPEPERRTLRLTGEAGTPDAMLDYLRRLGESKLLTGVHLVSHQVRREETSYPVRFVAQAALRERDAR